MKYVSLPQDIQKQKSEKDVRKKKTWRKPKNPWTGSKKRRKYI